MDFDSDEEKYYESEDTEDEEEPHPPARRSSISQPTGRKLNSFAVHSMDKRWHVLGIITYYDCYISRTIIGMELTGEMTDCGKYETYLKL
jgi:hypothetical protein